MKLSRRHNAGPYVVLVTALLMTAAATVSMGMMIRERDDARFENAVQSAQDRIVDRIEAYVAALRGAAGLYAARGPVSRRGFRTYADAIDVQGHYPGIQGIGYASRIRADAVDSLTAAARAEGLTDYRVWPAPAVRGAPPPGVSASTQNHDRAGPAPRGVAYPVVYLEPLDLRNRAALGFDMFSEPVRREAMERARDTGAPALSGLVRLKQEIDTAAAQPGFLIYLPLYRGGVTPAGVAARREAIAGFVYAPFRAADLFTGTFGRETSPRVAFQVYDGARRTPDALLYDSRPPAAAPAASPDYTRTIMLEIAGRTWTLAFESLPAFERGSGRGFLPALAAAGLVVSLVLFGVTRAEAAARRTAEQSEAARARFFNAMSHELRTPVNAIVGYNDLLLNGLFGSLDARPREGVERSQKAAHHLVELVNDVLDLSKLEARRMTLELEDTDLRELVDDLLATIRPMAEERGCALVIESTPGTRAIRTDPRRVRQILLNLLSNATKFGAGRPVTVRCSGTADGIAVSVMDEGPGIPAEQLDHIFEEFVQLPGGAHQGTGLGLPISRRLATLLGGTLAVASGTGAGSAFTLRLPLAPPIEASPRA